MLMIVSAATVLTMNTAEGCQQLMQVVTISMVITPMG
jgi:hypothetical protein